MLKRVHCPCSLCFRTRSLKAWILVPPHQHPGTSGINSIPMTLRQLREAQRPMVPTSVRPREVGWRSSSTPKNDGIFFGMGGMLVLEEGENLVFFCWTASIAYKRVVSTKKIICLQGTDLHRVFVKGFLGWFSQTKNLQRKNSSRRCKNPPCLRWGKR